MQRILATILLLLTYRVNYLSSSGQLWENLVNLREVFPFEYMPVWLTFAVARSAIYLSLGIRSVWSWTSYGKNSETNNKILPRFIASSVFNIVWIFCTAREQYALSVVVIAWLMLILWKILGIISGSTESTKPRWIMSIPFGLYAGRVTMATCVVGSSQLVYTYRPSIPTTTRWMICVLIFGISIASYIYYKHRNLAQLVITLWALVGIAASIFG